MAWAALRGNCLQHARALKESHIAASFDQPPPTHPLTCSYRASDSLAYLGCCYEPFDEVGKRQLELRPTLYPQWLTKLKKTCPV
jgi:hypothetical protein